MNQTRSLSEGITGYEVQTTSLYGVTTGISEGSLYIDVDTDSHSVVSLNGEKDTPKEYMVATGMLSSLYESLVWEEITGCQSASTISILAHAQKNNIDILVIAKENMSTEIEKLQTDDVTRQTVMNAVNSGKLVTIPAQNVAIGNWNGTGYIITNPETGAGSYMISRGLNGGSVCNVIDSAFMVTQMYLSWSLETAVQGMIGMVEIFSCQFLYGGYLGLALAGAGIVYSVRSVVNTCNHLANIMQRYYDYILDDSDKNAAAFFDEMSDVFDDNFFYDIAKDGAVDYAKWFYKWMIEGGSIY